MKRLFLFAAAVSLVLGVQAQENRRLLTMEEAVLMGGVAVAYPVYSWEIGGSVYT